MVCPWPFLQFIPFIQLLTGPAGRLDTCTWYCQHFFFTSPTRPQMPKKLRDKKCILSVLTPETASGAVQQQLNLSRLAPRTEKEIQGPSTNNQEALEATSGPYSLLTCHFNTLPVAFGHFQTFSKTGFVPQSHLSLLKPHIHTQVHFAQLLHRSFWEVCHKRISHFCP